MHKISFRRMKTQFKLKVSLKWITKNKKLKQTSYKVKFTPTKKVVKNYLIVFCDNVNVGYPNLFVPHWIRIGNFYVIE